MMRKLKGSCNDNIIRDFTAHPQMAWLAVLGDYQTILSEIDGLDEERKRRILEATENREQAIRSATCKIRNLLIELVRDFALGILLAIVVVPAVMILVWIFFGK